ncbi:MAG TPA: zinc ribbon domain-containing protein [Candidatus Limihabitans stercoravium]|nr:zinc ribbon domain-containing protein [Candidatus Limihabitans stercoravium]
MNNSNSFNICPRCGTANSLNAKYCYQCGSQLRVPEEPVRCPKCNTVNSSLANFCRTCGTVLKTASKTRICPRCGKEVPMEEHVCSCGYSFVNVGQTNPSDSAQQTVQSEVAPTKKARGGRLVALFSIIFWALFAYVCFAPQGWLPEFMKTPYMSSSVAYANAFDFAKSMGMQLWENKFAVELSLYTWITGSVIAVTSLCMLVHVISAIVRLCAGGRPKRANVFYFVMALLTTIATAMVLLPLLNVEWLGFLDMFAPSGADTRLTPYIAYTLPVYFWFFWIYSFIARKRVAK